MSAPAVTGAVALYKSAHPSATPSQVKEALQYLGNLNWATSTDPDSTNEKLLDVSRIGKQGSFYFADGATGSAGEAGGTASVAVNIDRTSTHFERVRFSIVGLPDGWTGAISPASLIGWTADSTNLSLDVPAGMPGGTYKVRIRATSLDRTLETDVRVVVVNDLPTANVGRVYPFVGSTVGVSGSVPKTVALRFAWDAATDPSSRIAVYQVQRSTNGSQWTDTINLGATARNVTINGLALGVGYAFRLRARDAVGNWSPWASTSTTRFSHLNDRSISVKYGGRWTRATSASAIFAVRTTSTQSGATAGLTFIGLSISLVMPRSNGRGKVTVYLDGARVTTIDTYATTGQARRIVFSKVWSTVGTHGITIRVAGTSGRPSVSLDGYVIGK